ncbi:hypothetical protein NBRC110019_16380 [Neptunitalea chrysea]|uniref:T9SS type A sorting domain-containing protein n=1 Tax=Neptunitalea chrysea TaxID=1647581 RepID=A0A9W6EW90_9FLAO|nr:hypothetical protein [Neptunitalea chrysea]GLB52598.1 hypothetical protein NBRC110019_16380 [Neptunitalea chrysea]
MQVYDTANSLLLTTQLAFPDATNTTVNNYYNTSGTNNFTNTNDMVFSDSYTDELMTVTGDTTNGYTATANIFVSATLGLDEFTSETGGQFSMLIAPNPVESSAQIVFNLIQPSEVSFEIIDITGKVLISIPKEAYTKDKTKQM